MFKKIALIAAGLILVVGISLFVWVASYPEIKNQKTSGGMPRNQSYYVTMRDGVKIAVDVWLPIELEEGEQVPALVAGTRYSRLSMAYDLNQKDKFRIRLSQMDKRIVNFTELEPESTWANKAGYAVVHVDARGSAASFGNRPIEWSPDEVEDYGEVITWIASQAWSNGKVGAWGTSYPGNTAELMASTGNPAFLATAPRFSDFDPLLGVGMPGGLRADGFLEQWSELDAAFDHEPAFSKVVDGDRGRKELEEAIAGHTNPDIFETMHGIEYRDDEFGQSGMTFSDVSPYSMREAIEENDVPMQVWVSWLDAATMDGALSRYLTFSNMQHVIIGPWNHGGGRSIDPFMPDQLEGDDTAQAMAGYDALKPQMKQVLDFFDCYLKNESCVVAESKITYYTLNSGEWQTTSVWPPEGFSAERFYFAKNGTLSKDEPVDDVAADEYTVDFTTTTGTNNRWMAQMGHDIDYTNDRASEDGKLLTYTSDVLTSDIEITGSPIVKFYVASTLEDGAFHIYLEDVAPDGKVIYITEGIMRAIHYPVSKEEAPFIQLGPHHSFERADAAPLVPGEVTEISMNLYATSVLIKEGHSLRIAIAGADADTFVRYPAEDSPVWTIQRSTIYPSYIELPIREK